MFTMFGPAGSFPTEWPRNRKPRMDYAGREFVPLTSAEPMSICPRRHREALSRFRLIRAEVDRFMLPEAETLSAPWALTGGPACSPWAYSAIPVQHSSVLGL